MGIRNIRKIEEGLDDLNTGESIIIPGRGGWEIVITKSREGFELTHQNPTEKYGSNLKFFRYTTVSNPYGAGIIEQEPSFGVPCRECGVDADGTIVGALVIDEAGKVIERFSWSNLVFIQGRHSKITQEGKLLVYKPGEGYLNKGYLQAMFLPDKNRMKGYVGVFGPTKPKKVQTLEMEDLVFSSLR